MRKYFKHKIKSLLVVNKIVVIHNFDTTPNFKLNAERHDFWELVYAEKGNLSCSANGNEIILHQGQMLFHKPNELHSLAAVENSPSSVFVVAFECLSESMHFFSNKIVALTQKQRRYVSEIADIAKKTFDIAFNNSETDNMTLLNNPTLGGEQIIKNNLEMLLIDLLRSLTETEEGNDVFLQEKEINNKLAEDIIKILKANVYSKINIDDVAKLTSYSKTYIFKQFKKATGCGVIEYYNNLKIKEAKKILIKEELTVREIADKLSFDTPNYFTKVFKKICKITPLAYKKRTSQ